MPQPTTPPTGDAATLQAAIRQQQQTIADLTGTVKAQQDTIDTLLATVTDLHRRLERVEAGRAEDAWPAESRGQA